MSGSPNSSDHADVLIIGAGPSGLSLAIELGRRGVKVIIVEQNDRVGVNPRAKTVNIRSMEHMRRWGIAENVRAAGPLPATYQPNVVFTTRLFGHQIARFENALFMSRERDERYAEASQWIPQYKFEAVLRDHAASLPSVRLRFSARLMTAVDEASGVRADVADVRSGQVTTIHVRYLVGADGARSKVRELIGARYTGEHGFASVLGLVLRMPGLQAAQPHGDALMYWTINADAPALMGPMDTGDLWFWGTPMPKDLTLDDAEIRRRVTASLGRDMPFEIITKDPWLAHSLIADRYARGRMFLIGDACHLHPPFGGYGMNLGIADAADLGWKLAATVQGWGGPALLDSFESERRPVHRLTIEEAVENLSFFGAYLKGGALEADTAGGAAAREQLAAQLKTAKQREFRGLGMALGMSYRGSPIVVPDGTAPPTHDPMTYTSSASPGARAPHAWMPDGTSLYDHFGPDFTLLHSDAADKALVTLLARQAAISNVPLSTLNVSSDIAATYGAALALVRPDQYVAWRGDSIGDDAESIFDTVRGRRAAIPETRQ